MYVCMYVIMYVPYGHGYKLIYILCMTCIVCMVIHMYVWGILCNYVMYVCMYVNYVCVYVCMYVCMMCVWTGRSIIAGTSEQRLGLVLLFGIRYGDQKQKKNHIVGT